MSDALQVLPVPAHGCEDVVVATAPAGRAAGAWLPSVASHHV